MKSQKPENFTASRGRSASSIQSKSAFTVAPQPAELMAFLGN